MPRSYRNIQQYEEEILRLRNEGYTRQQIVQKLGLQKVQIKAFVNRYNKKKAKIEAGVVLRRKGRPPKDYVVSETDKVAELKYILSRKATRNKNRRLRGWNNSSETAKTQQPA